MGIKEGGTATDSGDRDSIYEVTPVDIGADVAGEKAGLVGVDHIWEPHPSYLHSSLDRAPRWNRFNRFFREGIPYDVGYPDS